MHELFFCTQPLTLNMGLGRPQVLFFKLLAWPKNLMQPSLSGMCSTHYYTSTPPSWSHIFPYCLYSNSWCFWAFNVSQIVCWKMRKTVTVMKLHCFWTVTLLVLKKCKHLNYGHNHILRSFAYCAKTASLKSNILNSSERICWHVASMLLMYGLYTHENVNKCKWPLQHTSL